MPSREELYAACEARFLKMIEQGAVEEARTFLGRNLDPDLPAMKTIGLREIASYLRGTISLDQAIRDAQQATRNYAKRQMTWFRNQELAGR
jgi:tRNA dimethylallyltransferase